MLDKDDQTDLTTQVRHTLLAFPNERITNNVFVSGFVHFCASLGSKSETQRLRRTKQSQTNQTYTLLLICFCSYLVLRCLL